MGYHPSILIIGGGASGMAAAIAAKSANPDCYVTILEKNARIGKKLLATGNGRCNIGNRYASLEHYYNHKGQHPRFVETALSLYPPDSNKAFFASLGLLIKEETQGKEYPYHNQASGVLDLLRLKLEVLEVNIQTNTEAIAVHPMAEGFKVMTNHGFEHCQRLILACGGVASPQLSNSIGLCKITDALRLKSTPTYPALVQIKTENTLPKALKGTKIDAAVTLLQDGQAVQAESGELLFTEYGVSGPPIFQLSRLVSQNFTQNKPQPQQLSLDLMPNYQELEILALLQQAQQAISSTLENYLSGLLPKRLGQQLLKHCGITPLSRGIHTLSLAELTLVAKTFKGLTLAVEGTTGWQNAQVMAGGLATDGFYAETLEAKQIPGLYATGEILDVYGDCGGYNLTWAWSSGRLAGSRAAGGQHA